MSADNLHPSHRNGLRLPRLKSETTDRKTRCMKLFKKSSGGVGLANAKPRSERFISHGEGDGSTTEMRASSMWSQQSP